MLRVFGKQDPHLDTWKSLYSNGIVLPTHADVDPSKKSRRDLLSEDELKERGANRGILKLYQDLHHGAKNVIRVSKSLFHKNYENGDVDSFVFFVDTPMRSLMPRKKGTFVPHYLPDTLFDYIKYMEENFILPKASKTSVIEDRGFKILCVVYRFTMLNFDSTFGFRSLETFLGRRGEFAKDDVVWLISDYISLAIYSHMIGLRAPDPKKVLYSMNGKNVRISIDLELLTFRINDKEIKDDIVKEQAFTSYIKFLEEQSYIKIIPKGMEKLNECFETKIDPGINRGKLTALIYGVLYEYQLKHQFVSI